MQSAGKMPFSLERRCGVCLKNRFNVGQTGILTYTSMCWAAVSCLTQTFHLIFIRTAECNWREDVAPCILSVHGNLGGSFPSMYDP